MTYTKLKTGQIRLKGDEVRRLGKPTYVTYKPSHYYDNEEPEQFIWHSVSLIGHPILQSDLMIAEFRREVAVD